MIWKKSSQDSLPCQSDSAHYLIKQLSWSSFKNVIKEERIQEIIETNVMNKLMPIITRVKVMKVRLL